MVRLLPMTMLLALLTVWPFSVLAQPRSAEAITLESGYSQAAITRVKGGEVVAELERAQATIPKR